MNYTKNENGELVPMTEAEVQAFNDSVDAHYKSLLEVVNPKMDNVSYHLGIRIKQAKRHQHFEDAEQLEAELSTLKNKQK
jgi:hypothetical protein